MINLSELYANEGPRMFRKEVKEDYDYKKLEALVIHLTRLEMAQELLGKKLEALL